MTVVVTAAAARSMTMATTAAAAMPTATVATATVAAKQTAATSVTTPEAAKQTAAPSVAPAVAATATHQQVNNDPADQYNQLPVVRNPLHDTTLSKHRPTRGALITTHVSGD